MALPTNNAEILANSDDSKDSFFLTGRLTQDKSGYQIDIAADGSIVAQKQDNAEATGAFFRKDWDNPDKRTELGVADNLRMIGAGGIVSVQIGEDEPQTILFEKTAGPSTGRMAQASGLSDEHPLRTLLTELVEETGILVVDEEQQKLSLVVIESDEFLPGLFETPEEQNAFFEDLARAKLGQIDNIRQQLPEDKRNWEINIIPKSAKPDMRDMDYLEEVTIKFPNQDPLTAMTIVSDSDKTANVNLLSSVIVNFEAGTQLMFVDPEEFQRPVQTFTRAQMLTPDFIENQASVPMRPYLENAMATEVTLTPPAPDGGTLPECDNF